MKKLIIIFLAVIILVLALGVSAYYFMTPNSGSENKTGGSQEKTEVAKLKCEPLVADKGITEGKAPFAPVLRGLLAGEYDPEQKICEWYIDGAISYSSFPMNGECVFGGNGLMTKGEHEIAYKLSVDQSCSSSIKVTVK